MSPRWDGRTLHWPVRVYYHHTDAGGVVYHGTYLDFMEAARIELLAAIGFDLAELAAKERSSSSSMACPWTITGRRGSASCSL